MNYFLKIRLNAEGRIAKIYAAVRDIPRAKRFFLEMRLNLFITIP